MQRSHPTTSNALKTLKPGKSWRLLAQQLGYDNYNAAAAMLARVANQGPVGRETENDLRRRLSAFGDANLPPLPDPVPVSPCPSCGHVHVVGDCHGIDGLPVIIPMDAKVVRKRKSRPPTPPAVRHAADNLIRLRQRYMHTPGSRSYWNTKRK